MSVSRKDDKCKEEEFPSVADIESGASDDPTCGSGHTVEIETSVESQSAQRRRRLHRVPQQVREKNKHIYDPLFVSIGPYHHGQQELGRLEEFKDEVLKIMLNSDGGADKGMKVHLRSKILERIDEIRSFYGGRPTDEYDDETLAEMMLRDACLVLYFMKMTADDEGGLGDSMHSIGLMRFSLMEDDFFKLENQIPWWVIMLLITLTHGDNGEKGEALIRTFLSITNFVDHNILKQVPWGEDKEKEPLHLLEALHTSLFNLEEINKYNADHHPHPPVVSSCPTYFTKLMWWRRKEKSRSSRVHELLRRPFRSATELKAKGIYFRPSSNFLNDIRFNSHPFYGVLHLPIQVVNSGTLSFFSNIIAQEMSPGNTSTDFIVTSYVNFMTSLIESEEDVKMLQEEGIIISYLEDNKHIVSMFGEIDTHGIDDIYQLNGIRKMIDEHCNSKAKTWIAELILTKFRNPWTTIAFLAGIFLVGLTLLQTYYTLNPRNPAGKK